MNRPTPVGMNRRMSRLAELMTEPPHARGDEPAAVEARQEPVQPPHARGDEPAVATAETQYVLTAPRPWG